MEEVEKKKREMEGCGDVRERRSGKEMKGEEVGEGDFTSHGNDFLSQEREREIEGGRRREDMQEKMAEWERKLLSPCGRNSMCKRVYEGESG